MDPGDVYRFPRFPLPDRRAGAAPGAVQHRPKYAVVLQGGPSFVSTSDLAVVVASSRRTPEPPKRYEVAVGQLQGFDHGTIIDCRWVYTLRREDFDSAQYFTHLPPPLMRNIRAAIIRGLQLLDELPTPVMPPPPPLPGPIIRP